MPCKQMYCFLLLMICLQFPLHAQMARYASIARAYDIKIPEKTGNAIHVWSASDEQSFFEFRKMTLTLHVFSQELQPIAEKKIELGKVKRWTIDFQYEDDCYYANIIVFSANAYRLLFKVDFTGMITNFSDSIGIWNKPTVFRQFNKAYAISQHNNKLFVIQTQVPDSLNRTAINNISLVGNENFNPGKDLQKIVIKRTNFRGREELEKEYASAYLNFSYPSISINDSTVIAYAFAQPVSTKDRSSPYRGSYMFLARFDTSLNERGEGAALLKITDVTKSDSYFTPCCSFLTGNKLVVVNIGRTYNETSPRYVPVYRGGYMTYVPQFYNPFFASNSLRITIVDGRNNLLKDTIIDTRNGTANLQWETRFIIASGKKIDFFCSTQYRASKFGITHISTDSDGTLEEQNIIVDEHYNYLLSDAKRLSAGVLLVPYAKNGRTRGIMRLEYERE